MRLFHMHQLLHKKYRERLENRLKELHNQDLDEQRLLTEVAPCESVVIFMKS